MHIEVIRKSPSKINDKNTDKNIDGNCALYKFVDVIE